MTDVIISNISENKYYATLTVTANKNSINVRISPISLANAMKCILDAFKGNDDRPSCSKAIK